MTKRASCLCTLCFVQAASSRHQETFKNKGLRQCCRKSSGCSDCASVACTALLACTVRMFQIFRHAWSASGLLNENFPCMLCAAASADACKDLPHCRVSRAAKAQLSKCIDHKPCHGRSHQAHKAPPRLGSYAICKPAIESRKPSSCLSRPG